MVMNLRNRMFMQLRGPNFDFCLRGRGFENIMGNTLGA